MPVFLPPPPPLLQMPSRNKAACECGLPLPFFFHRRPAYSTLHRGISISNLKHSPTISHASAMSTAVANGSGSASTAGSQPPTVQQQQQDNEDGVDYGDDNDNDMNDEDRVRECSSLCYLPIPSHS